MKIDESHISHRAIVSVIVPVYNCADTIAETIESVLSQSYRNWELVCVDDGSTDEGDVIIEKYCKADSRIRFIRRSRLPKGGSVCRNIGALEAKGDYLLFLDGDDLLAKTCIENRLKSIENYPYDFVVFPMASFKDDPSQAVKCSRTDVKNMKYYFASAQGGWQVTSPIYKTGFFKNINGFNESFPRLQDIELHFRAIISSKGNYLIRNDAIPDCYYRMSDNHYTTLKIEKGLNAHKLFFKLLKDNISEMDNVTNRSIAILCNCCSILIELSYLEKHGNHSLSYEDIIDFSVLLFLTPRHKVLFKLFLIIFHNKIGTFLIKMTRKLLLLKFIYIK